MAKANDYRQLHDREWVRIPLRGHKDACCGCNLVHTMNYRIVNGTLELQAIRDPIETAAMRRKKIKRG